MAIPAIGPGVAALMREFRATGGINQLIPLEQAYPAESSDLRRLPRMSPNVLRQLRAEMAVDTRTDLVIVLETRPIEDLPGVGPQTERLWLEILRLPPRGRSVPAHRAWVEASSLARHIATYSGC